MPGLTEHLLAAGFPEATLTEAAPGESLIARLWAAEGIDQERVLKVLSDYFDLPAAFRLEETISPRDLGDVPLAWLKANLVAPIRFEDATLTVALADPTDLALLADLRLAFKARRVELRLAPPAEIQAAVARLYEGYSAATQEAIEEIDGETAGLSLADLVDETEDLIDATSDAPVVRLLNLIMVEAVKRRASDIHIEPYRDKLKVRYRIDGLLHDVHTPPRRLAAAISSRIKVLSDLDIAERRLPQDGRFRINVANQEIDVRVSVMPTSFGERIVLRLLNKAQAMLSLTELGMADDTLTRLMELIARTSGIILVTGPTGSGKTTTLYAALSAINTPEKNILTVEDPVEYQIPGVGQMQITTKVGLTFARALRSILRHDPDVIMVGEIRDVETAQIAIHASQTGHLVFSTLHTNDAVGALTRLLDMGIEPFLISSSLAAVLAQRLVRLICPHCKEETEPPRELLDRLGLSRADGPFYAGRGCEQCFGSGYLGRAGIFELLVVDEPIRELVMARASAGTITAKAAEGGMRSLLSAGAVKVKNGQTTPAEVLRVVHA